MGKQTVDLGFLGEKIYYIQTSLRSSHSWLCPFP
jgi:hypothetical protein